jgi:hypothetical protein
VDDTIPPPLNTFHDLPEVVISALPEPRRTLHRKAVELVIQNAAIGTPFVLLLRTYAVAQLFVTADDAPAQPLENLVQEGLKDTGIGLIEVQVGGGKASSELYRAEMRSEMQVQTPSLLWNSRHAIGFPPCIRQIDYVRLGGLLSYGYRNTEMIRAAATYVDKILKGANAGDLPLTIWDRYYLTVNAKTAAALNLTLPTAFLSQADEVVE